MAPYCSRDSIISRAYSAATADLVALYRRLGGVFASSTADLVAAFRRLGSALPQTWWRYIEQNTTEHCRTLLPNTFQNLQNKQSSKRRLKKGKKPSPHKPSRAPSGIALDRFKDQTRGDCHDEGKFRLSSKATQDSHSASHSDFLGVDGLPGFKSIKTRLWPSYWLRLFHPLERISPFASCL